MKRDNSSCKGCGRGIVWCTATCPDCHGARMARTSRQRCGRCQGRGHVKVPLDASAPVFYVHRNGHGHRLTETAEGARALVSHFATCPAANHFSRGRRAGS